MIFSYTLFKLAFATGFKIGITVLNAALKMDPKPLPYCLETPLYTGKSPFPD